MDLLSAFFGLLDLLLPPKDERGKRWHRIGCFVSLGFCAVAAFIGGLIYLRGQL